MEKAQFVVGFIRGSHGYAGECKVESTSGEYEHFLNLPDLKEVTLQHGDIQRVAKVESVALGSNIAYVKFSGINSSEEVVKYNRWEIVVPRKYAKPLRKGEWYIEDLRNCSLVWLGNSEPAALDAPADNKDTSNSVGTEVIVGTITDVLEGGAGYLLQVSLSESCTCISDEVKFGGKKGEKAKAREVFVPFTEKFIGKVDVKHGTVQLMHLWILE